MHIDQLCLGTQLGQTTLIQSPSICISVRSHVNALPVMCKSAI